MVAYDAMAGEDMTALLAVGGMTAWRPRSLDANLATIYRVSKRQSARSEA